METILTKSPVEAAHFIMSGGIVAFPTETVYGLGADIFNETAISSIFEAKRRPADNPLIAHIGSMSQVGLLAKETTVNARLFMDAFFPGPLTIVFEKRDEVPLLATAGLDSIAIRMPRDPFAREFLMACGTPVAAPSANISGRPSPTTWQAVYEDLNGRIDCVLQGDPTEIGLESTVVDCRGETPVILRQGAITREHLIGVVPQTGDFEVAGNGTFRSPGMRHAHYSPRALVRIVTSASEAVDPMAAYIGVDPPMLSFAHSHIAGDLQDYAHTLFEFFRECDRRGIETIYCEAVDEIGLGRAIMDRIRRAAGA